MEHKSLERRHTLNIIQSKEQLNSLYGKKAVDDFIKAAKLAKNIDDKKAAGQKLSELLDTSLKNLHKSSHFMKYKTQMMTKMKESINQRLDSKLNKANADNNVFSVDNAITIAKLLLIQNLLIDIDEDSTNYLFDDIIFVHYTSNPNGCINHLADLNHLADQVLKHIQLPTTDYSEISIKDKKFIIKSTLSSIEKENRNNDL